MLKPDKPQGIKLSDRASRLLWAVGIGAGIFHLCTGFFGLLSSTVQRGTHWFFMLVIVLLLHRSGNKKWAPSVDFLLIAGAMLSTFYLLATWESRVSRIQPPTSAEVIFGAMMIVLTLEAARRTAGWFLVLSSSAFLAYAWIGPYLPGIFGHRGYSIPRIVSYLYMTTDGIYGTPIGVSATYIVLFVLFGTFLNAAGGGQFFLSLSQVMAGRWRGGAAKTSVVSSTLMGTISGSPVANAVTTGTFTVPMMMRSGYSATMAAGVEAAASTGSMIMPPIMGSAAFIMAEFLQVEYREIAVAALIPAVLYFAAIFFMVDLRARAVGIDVKQVPAGLSFWRVLANGWHVLAALLGLIFFLIIGWSAIKSVLWSILLIWVLSLFHKNNRLTPGKWAGAVLEGMQASAVVAAACAAAGIILGVINLTGLGLTFSTALLDISGGHALPALMLTMLASIILGMGLPAAAVYIVVAALAAPPLVEMGFSALGAHMFVFYFGIMSTITPPVALTAYAAAGVAGADPMKTAWAAARLGLVGYVIPFMFVYSPSLLFEGGAISISLAVLSALVGVAAVAIALEGYFLLKLSRLQRLMSFAGGLFLVKADWITDLCGLALLAIAAIWIAAAAKRGQAVSETGIIQNDVMQKGG